MIPSNERGSALIITLMLLLILTAIGIYAISISTTEMSIALQSKTGAATMNAAEAGVAYGIDRIPNTDNNYIGTLPGYIGTLTGNGAYQVTTTATPNFTVMPGYGANFRFQDFNVDGTGATQSGFTGTRRILAVVSYGPQPIGTMY
jgi:hypothetical protein